MKNELGFCTNLLSLWHLCCCSELGLRRSMARVCVQGEKDESVMSQKDVGMVHDKVHWCAATSPPLE